MKNIKYLKNIEQFSAKDAAIAGGKGASLGELMKLKINVPAGFVVLASAFDKFLEENNLNIEIKTILDSVNYKKIRIVENASERIKKIVLEADMPKEIEIEIKNFFKKLDTEYVAVRSSATAEDSESAAWAGQLESYLNTDGENLLKNIKKCWASLFTPRAIFYRLEKDLQKQKISVAVVVQKMVKSEKSGVAFSVHPVTQDKNQLIIEAGFGFGEAIVSGQITPDSYVVEKQLHHIIDKNIRTEKQVLSDDEILELSEIILKIENHFGFPCDIEWAFEKGESHIVQSRAITTIQEAEQEYRKIMVRPLDLSACECWDAGERLFLPKKFQNLLFFDPLFKYKPEKATTIYYNFTDPKQNLLPLLKCLEKNLRWFSDQKEIFDRNCNDIRLLIGNKSEDYEQISFLIKEIWPMIAVANIFGSTDVYEVKQKLRNICIKIREESDDVLHPALSLLSADIRKKIAREFPKLADFAPYILISELVNKNTPDKNNLLKRSRGYIFHRGSLYFNADNYKKNNKIRLFQGNETPAKGDLIRGQSASRGRVKGKAKIVFELIDLQKIKKGDILVAPMTTPDMIVALNIAIAIVTDEGGITSHAAIISRELKKTCVIGTKIATKLIKDGDIIEVDGNNGLVRILK
ncbi:MAG: PEP-utilizing enzyme [Candidatus Moranbacteria bacterium]|nr:PEP-utilizing enzyme [Candidatus Moranbacteria bacterium]